jgi:hypothetical protein
VPGVSVSGVWLVRWTATGTGVVWASETQFQVRAVGVEQLVDLPSVKAHLNIPPTDIRQDDELQGFILAAADLARDHCGPFIPETHTQYLDGGRPSFVPDWLPVKSVLSVTEFYGLGSFVLTETPLGGGTSSAFAYTVDYGTGELTRRTFSGDAVDFAEGEKNVKIVYTAGRSTVPYSVRLGVLELVRHLWQLTQQGGRPRFGGAGDGGEPFIPTGFALPSRVLELWAPFRRPPGIA